MTRSVFYESTVAAVWRGPRVLEAERSLYDRLCTRWLKGLNSVGYKHEKILLLLLTTVFTCADPISFQIP